MATEISSTEKTTVYTGAPWTTQLGCGVAFVVATTVGAAGYALPPPRPEAQLPEIVAASGAVPVEVEFHRLADRWRVERMQSPTSDLRRILMLPSYLQIITLGKSAIPSILAEFQARPHHWWLALEAISRENPVSPASKGNLDAIREAWLEWGRANRYIT